MAHLLILEARFYEDLADEMAKGAIAVLEHAGASYERVAVPGAFELPTALAMALEAVDTGLKHYDGYVVLGCVIRGETTHYEIVSNESARALIEIASSRRIALGNGILTVEDDDQAWARARVGEQNKGGGAAEAALAMIALRKQFGLT